MYRFKGENSRLLAEEFWQQGFDMDVNWIKKLPSARTAVLVDILGDDGPHMITVFDEDLDIVGSRIYSMI